MTFLEHDPGQAGVEPHGVFGVGVEFSHETPELVANVSPQPERVPALSPASPLELQPDFLAELAHELRSPLTCLLANLELGSRALSEAENAGSTDEESLAELKAHSG